MSIPETHADMSAIPPGEIEAEPRRSFEPGTSLLGRLALVFILIALIGLFSGLSPDTFPRYANFTAIVAAAAPMVFLSLAETLTLRVGDFDLSISATMITSAVIVGEVLTRTHLGSGWATVFALVASLIIGLVNGVLVVLCKLDSFITTLGTMTAVTGIGYALSNSQVIYGYGGNIVALAQHQVGGITLFVIFGWVLALLLLYVFEWTVVGRQWVFTGGNRDAGVLIGLPVARLRISAFVLGGLFSGIAGVLLAGSLGSVVPSSGGDYLLTPFAAAFLGTVAISIGRFNVLGTLIGLYILGVGASGLQLLGAPNWISYLFEGVMLVAALAFTSLIQRRRPNQVTPLLRRFRDRVQPSAKGNARLAADRSRGL
jgi:ribose transport system permease protein